MNELVEGRIPTNGDIEIRFCKPAVAGAGPSNMIPPIQGAGNSTPLSGRNVPYDEDDVPRGSRESGRNPGNKGGGGPDGGDGGSGTGNVVEMMMEIMTRHLLGPRSSQEGQEEGQEGKWGLW